MDLLPSPEQNEIVESAAAFLRDRLPMSRTRALLVEPDNVDAAAWTAAAELGWFALGLPEAYGGVGCGLADESLLFREIGRSLATGPFLSTVLGARVAAFGGRAELAGEITSGRRVGLAVPSSLDLLGTDGTITGSMQLIDSEADLVLVATPTVSVLVERSALTDIVAVRCYDDGVRLRRATADRVRPVASVETSTDPVERRGLVLAAAMLTGITEAVRDISSAHAKNRVQFDRPIGVNQAIKHPCADMAVQAELALSQTLFAALASDEGRTDAEFHAISARLVAGAAAEHSTAATIQILGGMGFTFEHDAHLYDKRAYVLGMLFGGTTSQLERLLAQPEPN